MKRRLIGAVLILLVLLTGGVLVATFLLGSIMKKGVETAGSSLTKVGCRVDTARLSLFSGSGQVKGLIVANPDGFNTPSAIRVGTIEVSVAPRSVFSDKVVVHSIRVKDPEITLEGNLQGNNLSKILDNVRSPSKKETGTGAPGDAESRKIQLDDLLITGGKIHLAVELLGKKSSAIVPLPEIHLASLGQSPEGITAAELSEKLLRTILESATRAASGELTSLGKDLGKAAQAIGTGSVQQVEKVTKGLGDLLKRK